MVKDDKSPVLELKIVSESSIDAIKTIERLFPDFKFKELKIENGYDFRTANVYTIKIHGMAKKTKSKH